MNQYFKDIQDGISSTVVGMKLTVKHLWAARNRRRENNVRESDYFFEDSGMVTMQYPFETMAIPDNGRYRLHNEMDDCIVCDKCAKICPVDCIEIEPIRATEEFAQASDGSPIRLYAAKFDIDMAKCCYCGLCTTVCPTECLTMTKTFDYSEFDVRDMLYHYANLTPTQAEEKKELWVQFQREKEAFKAAQETEKVAVVLESEVLEPVKRPAFKPAMKPKAAIVEAVEIPAIEPVIEILTATEPPKRPVFKPSKKPEISVEETPLATEEKKSDEEPIASPARPKPVFRPTMKPKE